MPLPPSTAPSPSSEAPASHVPPAARKRDAAATRARILEAGRAAFAREGFAGARVDAIARAAGTNVQMLYRYFGDKEGLYRAVLEATYAHLRAMEQGLELATLSPEAGIRRLVDFTFDYLQTTPDFVAIIRNENMAGASFARQMPQLNAAVRPLLEAIDDLLARGLAQGRFTRRPTAADLYITILSLAITPVAQRATLSALFGFDLADPAWLAHRRAEMGDMVLGFLATRAAGAALLPSPSSPAPAPEPQ